MKYFKYPFQSKIFKALYRKRINLFDRKNKRNYYLRKLLFRLNLVIFFLIIIGLIILFKYLGNIESINEGLLTFLQIINVFFIVILPLATSIFLTLLIDKLFPLIAAPQINKKIVEECVLPLKNYYKVSDNHIITKCYDSSDAQLINKDLLLYIHKDNLRIVNDFTNTIKDIGCYEIPKDELNHFYGSKDNLTTTVIQCDEFNLMLGKRAKPFIDKNLFNND